MTLNQAEESKKRQEGQESRVKWTNACVYLCSKVNQPLARRFFLQIIWLLSLQAFLSNVFGSNFEKPREGERVSMKYVCIVFLF